MEFFGVSKFGYRETFKETLVPGYKDPIKSTLCVDFDSEKNKSRRAVDCIRNIDVYIENCDGYAYGSRDRLQKMRKKAMWKPVGPTDMHRYPITEAQVYGFWMADPTLKENKWFLPDNYYPNINSTRTIFCNFAWQTDKMFRI